MRQDLETVYAHRFAGTEAQRNEIWQVLTRRYFQRRVKPTNAVLDVGTGYCEFSDNIRAARKYGLDLNPITPLKAEPDAMVLSQDVTQPWAVAAGSVDVVFSSNFFEHLHTKVFFSRWDRNPLMFTRICFNHDLPLSDHSVVEAVELAGLRKKHVVSRFLSFTMKGKIPPLPILVRLYLFLPVLWRVLGKQFLVVAASSTARIRRAPSATSSRVRSWRSVVRSSTTSATSTSN